jgi:hypothetical protein
MSDAREARDVWRERADEIRDRIAVSSVVGRVVTLKKAGREFSGLCPFHNERTPSFTVNDGKGFYHCFGCGEHGSAIDFVMRHQGKDFKEAVELIESENGLRSLQPERRSAPPPPRKRQEQDPTKRDAVLEIWRAAVPIEPGSLVDRYLRGRCLVPPAEYGFGEPSVNGGWWPSLRFGPRVWHGLEKRHLPAMVAAMRKPDGRLGAVHRTYLMVRADGTVTKAGTRRDKAMFGDVRDTLIPLGPAAEKMTGGEGIETSLSAMQIFRRSGFAFGARAGMGSVEPPFECSDFIYAADRNKAHPDPERSRVGERAAWKGARAFGAGRRMRVKIPVLPEGQETGDFNDALVARMREVPEADTDRKEWS